MNNSLKCRIGPSILNADLSNLAEECIKLMAAGADYLHLDVMDGKFVPNLTFGPPVIKCLRRKVANAFVEAHMMVENPLQWIAPCADSGVNQYTFHIETCNDIEDACRQIKESGMKVGLAIKPNTPVQQIMEYVQHADMILVMTVEPGFGGQKFMESMMEKVSLLRSEYPSLDIEVDGGVGLNNISCCARAGANMIVSGTAVTASNDPQKVISGLRDAVLTYIK